MQAFEDRSKCTHNNWNHFQLHVSRYFPIFSLSWFSLFTLWPTRTAKSTKRHTLSLCRSLSLFQLSLGLVFWLGLGDRLYASKSQRIFCVAFFRTASDLCLYHLVVWLNFNFLHNSYHYYYCLNSKHRDIHYSWTQTPVSLEYTVYSNDWRLIYALQIIVNANLVPLFRGNIRGMWFQECFQLKCPKIDYSSFVDCEYGFNSNLNRNELTNKQKKKNK